MTLRLPELSIVLLIGPSGSGKSSFARKHFKPTEIVSSDVCRGLVSDDENDQSVTPRAFELLNFTLRQRLALGRLTVVDATNLNPEDRARLVAIAREFHVLPAALVFKIDESICHERNALRPDRDFGPQVLKRQFSQLRRGLKHLKKEGFRHVTYLRNPEEIDAVEGIVREPLWNNRAGESGPFDIVGDVHGCYDELRTLLSELGYTVADHVVSHPAGRRLVFVGDLVDRGPDSPNVLRLAMASVKAGSAICVPGNHDAKFLRWLKGKKVQPTHGLAETIAQEGWLERPEEAFDYFRQQSVNAVVCEEKHMGSRAVAVVCRDPAVAVSRFGLRQERRGVIYTRTGRPFFSDAATEAALLDRLAAALDKAGLWEELATDWLCLDAELMPWSVKARDLIQSQYAAVAAAGSAHAAAVSAVLESALQAGHLEAEARVLLEPMLGRASSRSTMLDRYRSAYRHYCWDVVGIDDLKLAPFHFLAGEGGSFLHHDHPWHMETAARLQAADLVLFPATRWREVDLDDADSVAEATTWWETMTAAGGEGMVVKPRTFIARGPRGLVQPAVKCRGREYLRIIYGPEYDAPENLVRLKQRGLGHKRSMAEREFVLGVEALDRFTARRPLREVHECVLAVLAMESEPVDPRL